MPRSWFEPIVFSERQTHTVTTPGLVHNYTYIMLTSISSVGENQDIIFQLGLSKLKIKIAILILYSMEVLQLRSPDIVEIL